MAEKKAKDPVNSKMVEEEVSTKTKVEAAKQANAKAAKATKEAAKANAEATAAVAKDTAKKTKKAAADAAKKGATVTKDTAKKAAGKATEAADKVKETTKSTYTRKPKRSVFIQYLGKEMTEDELVDRAIAQFGATEGSIPVKKISLYIKPEEMAAYYVINEQYTGRVDF